MFQKVTIILILLSAVNCTKRVHLDPMRFTSERMDGIYIPINLEDCIGQIDSFLTDSTKQEIMNLSEDEFISKSHFGLGIWMRNNWGLWKGSRLSKFFNELQIYHPDDMSGIILTSYHRKLNNKSIELDDQLQYYHNYWKDFKKKE